ncbi:phage tail family protein [Staphylococcus saprophyticus]|uniref:phage tail domain-containing protein n=1 Tax=Staphylococcus saprophyticus TaxID=29385 RepID=UPI0008532FD6|nr:phage tail domain-containing protein [Staphylococcus saprophyticus]MDW3871252.1 phage tail family protein [Staphylococcus saprophyticus]MDW4026242.1 phage tail family protein [Staphylococcus saprophyticus]OEK40130.1 hypothetical protein ASS89_08555 [Staphylococcus saprophyticus]
MLISHDVEIVKNNKYRISDNSFTGTDLVVASFNVEGAEYERDFETIDRINGRFLNSSREDHKTVKMTLRYNVDKPAYAALLKSRMQSLLSGSFYMRELATNDNTIPYISLGQANHSFDLEYVDGRQIKVVLTSPISFDTTQTAGLIDLEFETIGSPYFESIAYSTELENDPNLNYWDVGEELGFDKEDVYRKCTFENLMDGWLYYAGDVTINQFTQDFTTTITLGENSSLFRFYISDSDLMEIKGLKLKKGDKIVFDGMRTYRNGKSIDEYAFGPQPMIRPGGNNFHFNQVVAKVVYKYKLYFR